MPTVAGPPSIPDESVDNDDQLHKLGCDGLGYYPDTVALPCSEFRGRKAGRVFTLRDNILGYHVDRPPKVDTVEAEAFKRLGWFQTLPAVAENDGAQPPECSAEPSNVAAFAGVNAPPDVAKSNAYTWKAAHNFVQRLRANPKRLGECSEELQRLLQSTSETDKKNWLDWRARSRIWRQECHTRWR